jgi:hypothetical protein
MQSEVNTEQNCILNRRGAHSRRSTALRGSQDLKILLGSVEVGVVSPGKPGYLSLTQRLGYLSSTPPTHQAGEFRPGMVRLGPLSSVGAKGCTSARTILLKSAIYNGIFIPFVYPISANNKKARVLEVWFKW